MVKISVISDRDRILGFGLGITLGLTLAFSYLPSIHWLYLWSLQWLPFTIRWQPKFIEMSLFALSSFFFFYSLPEKARTLKGDHPSVSSRLPSLVIPTLIAFIFGYALRSQFLIHSQERAQDIFWFVFCIPIGEELLFRGWVWTVLRSLFKQKLFSITNPLPAELIFSSVAFSLWHIQNLGRVSVLFLFFQVLYTFFTGVWLGYLRWTTGKITLSILAHFLINLAASLPTLL